MQNSFDHPLSSRFDESDCFVVLDNVFIPWEHVFIYRNLEVCRDQWWKTPAHAYGNLQAQARYATKLRFMIGMAKKMNAMTGNENVPPVMVAMGELAALVQMVETMLEAQETKAHIDEKGVVWPSLPTLYAVMAMQSEFNPRMIEIIRELTGSAMITMPSSVKDLDSPETAADIERYMHSGNATARERIQLMRMAWDFIGSEFGNRHAQYEKFYGGASFLVKMNMNRAYDFNRATALVERRWRSPPIGDGAAITAAPLSFESRPMIAGLSDPALLVDRCYIGGQWIGKPQDGVFNPATGDLIGEVASVRSRPRLL